MSGRNSFFPQLCCYSFFVCAEVDGCILILLASADSLRPTFEPSTDQEGTKPAPHTQPSPSDTGPKVEEPIPLEVKGDEEAPLPSEKTLVPIPQSIDREGEGKKV